MSQQTAAKLRAARTEIRGLRNRMELLEHELTEANRASFAANTACDLMKEQRDAAHAIVVPHSHANLIARLDECRRMIGKMCSEGRPPTMSIPCRPDVDEDVVICRTLKEAMVALGHVEPPKATRPDFKALEAALHPLWTACVGTPDYDKAAWKNVQTQLMRAGRAAEGRDDEVRFEESMK